MPAIGPDFAVSPAEWGARVDYDSWSDVYSPDDAIALHHGGAPDYSSHKLPYSRAKEERQLRSWEKYHLSKGWRGIAYGWAVGQSGTVYRLRGWGTYGAHLGDIDGDGISNNKEIVPILFVGSGNHVSLSPAAQLSLEKLRRWLEGETGTDLPLFGHREIQVDKPTSCPGPLLMEYVESHRDLEGDDEMPLSQEDIDAVADAVAARFELRDFVDLNGVQRVISQVVVSSVWHAHWNGRKFANWIALTAKESADQVLARLNLTQSGE